MFSESSNILTYENDDRAVLDIPAMEVGRVYQVNLFGEWVYVMKDAEETLEVWAQEAYDE